MNKIKLFLLFIITSITQEICTYYHYFDIKNNSICTFNYSCPIEYNKLIPKKKECTKDCKKDPIYRYEYKYECLDKCPSPETELINGTYCSEICTKEKPFLNTLTHECVSSCYKDDLINNKCIIKYNLNQAVNNNTFLKKCENILKQYYNLSKEAQIIFILDANTQYEAYYNFNSINKKQLNMSLCNNIIPQETIEYHSDTIYSIDYNDIINIKCNIDNPFLNLLTKECIKTCEMNDLLNEKCILNYLINDTEAQIDSDDYNLFQNIFMQYVEDFFTSEKYYEKYLSSLNNEDKIMISGNMRIILTTSENQLINKDDENSKDKTTIDLEECENILKRYYYLKKLYIKKIVISEEDINIQRIEFDIYGEQKGFNHLIKLNKSICENKISLYIPIHINESIYKYDIYSGYYSDICYSINSDETIDLSLDDKKINFFQENKFICQENCDFASYNNITEIAQCSCEMKQTSQLYYQDIKINKKTLYENFEKKIEEQKKTFNFGVLSCNVLSDTNNVKDNAGFYVLLIINSLFIATMFFFYNQGLDWLKNNMNEIIQKKFGNEGNEINNNNPPIKHGNKNENKNNNKTDTNKKKIKKIEKKKKTGKKDGSKLILKKDIKKHIKKDKDKDNDKDNSIPLKISDSKNYLINKKIPNQINLINLPINITSLVDSNIHDLKNDVNYNNNDNSDNSNNNENYNNIKPVAAVIQPILLPETDYELNWLSYKEALKYDKRQCSDYYCSLIKTKQLILFSFWSMIDYNSNIIKKSFIFLSFAYHYTINAFLFNDSTLHQIYTTEGKFDLAYQMPTIFYSTLFSSYLLKALITYLALNDKDVLEVKKQVDKNIAIYMREKKFKCARAKFIVFFGVNMLLLLFFWYYLICFNAVYKNSQKYLIENTFLSFGFSLAFPFITNLFPTMMRNFAMNSEKGNNGYCYYASQVTQFIFI